MSEELRSLTDRDRAFVNETLTNEEILFMAWTRKLREKDVAKQEKPHNRLVVVTNHQVHSISLRKETGGYVVKRKGHLLAITHLGYSTTQQNVLEILFNFGTKEEFEIRFLDDCDDALRVVQHVFKAVLIISYGFSAESLPILSERTAEKLVEIRKSAPKQSALDGHSRTYRAMCNKADTPIRAGLLEYLCKHLSSGATGSSTVPLDLNKCFDGCTPEFCELDVVALAPVVKHAKCFYGVMLTDLRLRGQSVAELFDAFAHNPTVHTVKLRNAGITEAKLLKVQHAGSNVRLLDLRDNNQITDKGVLKLSQVIKTPLAQLNIANCGVNAGAGFMSLCKNCLSSTAWSTTLKALNVSSNRLGQEGSQALSLLIGSSKALHTLLAFECDLDLGKAFSSLSANPELLATLVHLDVSSNDMGASGGEALGYLLQHTVALKSLLLLSMKGFSVAACTSLFTMAGLNSHPGMGVALDLSNTPIKGDPVKAISKTCKMAKHFPISQMVLNSCGLGIKGLELLSESLPQNKAVCSSLRLLSLEGNVKIGLLSGFTQAASLSKLSTSVASLACQMSLQALYLTGDDDHFLLENLVPMLVALSFNNSLRILNIANNRGGDSIATTLAVALRSNKVLEMLDIDGSNISLEGYRSLTAGLQENKSLIDMPAPTRDLARLTTEENKVIVQSIAKGLQAPIIRNVRAKQGHVQRTRTARTGSRHGVLDSPSLEELSGLLAKASDMDRAGDPSTSAKVQLRTASITMQTPPDALRRLAGVQSLDDEEGDEDEEAEDEPERKPSAAAAVKKAVDATAESGSVSAERVRQGGQSQPVMALHPGGTRGRTQVVSQSAKPEPLLATLLELGYSTAAPARSRHRSNCSVDFSRRMGSVAEEAQPAPGSAAAPATPDPTPTPVPTPAPPPTPAFPPEPVAEAPTVTEVVKEETGKAELISQLSGDIASRLKMFEGGEDEDNADKAPPPQIELPPDSMVLNPETHKVVHDSTLPAAKAEVNDLAQQKLVTSGAALSPEARGAGESPEAPKSGMQADGSMAAAAEGSAPSSSAEGAVEGESAGSGSGEAAPAQRLSKSMLPGIGGDGESNKWIQALVNNSPEVQRLREAILVLQKATGLSEAELQWKIESASTNSYLMAEEKLQTSEKEYQQLLCTQEEYERTVFELKNPNVLRTLQAAAKATLVEPEKPKPDWNASTKPEPVLDARAAFLADIAKATKPKGAKTISVKTARDRLARELKLAKKDATGPSVVVSTLEDVLRKDDASLPAAAAAAAEQLTAKREQAEKEIEQMQFRGETMNKEIDLWQGRVDSAPEKTDVMRQREEQWEVEQRAHNQEALRLMRSLVPVDITTVADAAALQARALEKGVYYPLDLCHYLKMTKILHWVVMHPDDVAKANFLAGADAGIWRNLQDYDLFEMRALFANLPAKFELDGTGKKAEWRA
ncbi:hypothetical protein CYMTET_11029 [Cymbomonas tetramitiformis]|uniref:Uncharacterized protein n=1 Tax=Cymbomonas tetramitiformis TaxID=36881 RepID=A0AAE0LDV3_9CHLO|nr:hypothetical protein CYMTET_11029 [Cymbomonas tetramitiformis]